VDRIGAVEMDKHGAERVETFVDALAAVIGHADRVRPLRDYGLGRLAPAERKSVEPLAAVTAPSRVSAQHQSLLHVVAQSPWSDKRVLARVLELTRPAITASEPIKAWIIDDTSVPKKGRHSVGVSRPYCGQLGPSRTTARSRFPFPSRTRRRACRSPTGFPCRRTGPPTPPAARQPVGRRR
jgi:SRSO17 transposase